MANDELLEELLEIEHRGWGSLCDSTGADFYGSIMTDDGVMVLAHGVAMDREAVVASLNEAPPWRTYQISDARLVEAGDDTAVVVYTGRAYRDGAEPAFEGLMSSVYVRHGGGWKLALYQQTAIPAAGT
jgi:hypothetical protein